MSFKAIFRLIITSICLLSVSFLFAEGLQKTNYKSLLKQKKKEILRLSQKERKIFKDLAKIEEKIAILKENILKLERTLKKLKMEKNRLLNEIKALKKEVKKREVALKKLLSLYWMVYLKKNEEVTEHPLILPKLKENWILILSLKIGKDTKDLLNAMALLKQRLIKLKEVTKNILNTSRSLTKERERLLDKKLYLFQEIRKIRTLKIQKEAQLCEIRATIKKLNLTRLTFYKKKFKFFKGDLPWPVMGKVVYKFNLKSRPPREGVGIKVAGEKKVRSIFWGKVVFCDKLRGFGNVVILFHGDNFYSLYAYLKESYVFVGQRVEQSEPVGITGFCPKCKGTGVYMEIRKGKTPVNPLKWLKKIITKGR